ncbi:MAG: DUF1080 domain-containing protein, partial [bacterium]|nr:DUF1080 domain-containing protein [bacterium]
MKLILLLLFSFPLVTAGADTWISLLDGATLNGWHVEAQPDDRGKRFWSVRDGTITCDSLGRGDHNYVWLLTGAEYGDFDLRLKVRGFPQSTE